MKRWIWIPIIAVVLLGGYFAIQQSTQSKREAILENLQTVEVKRSSLTAIVGATGVVRADQYAVLSFKTSGIVDKVNAQTGDDVVKDEELASLLETSLPAQVILAQADLVAAQKAMDDLVNSQLMAAQAQQALAQARDVLDNAEYRWRVQQEGYRASEETIAAKEANLVLAQNEVDKAQHEYSKYSGRPEDDPSRAQARSNLADARKKRDSIQRSLNWYRGSPTDIDQAILDADVAIAQARLDDAESEYERWKDGPPADEIAAAQARITAAQANIELGRISVPFSGTITSAEIKPGDQASLGTVAFTLSDLSPLLVDVDVSEVDINRIELGQSVEMTFDAVLDRIYGGKVVEVGMEGKPMQGVVNYEITVEMIVPDKAIKPGLTAAVNIIVNELEDVLLVPNRAVRLRDGVRVVYVISAGIMEPVPVVLGASAETYSEVIDGELKEGDQIVLNPPMEFESGNHRGPGMR